MTRTKSRALLSLALAVLLLFTAIPAFAAEGEEAPNTYEEKLADLARLEEESPEPGYLYWLLDRDGILHIGGEGHIENFTSTDDQPWGPLRDGIYAVLFDCENQPEYDSTQFWFDGCENLDEDNIFDAEACALFKEMSTYTADDCKISTCICTGPCEYGYTNYRTAENPDQYHIMSVCCTGCGWTNGYPVAEAHTFSGNTCTLCGYTKACAHSSVTRKYITSCDWQDSCKACGEVVATGTLHGPYDYGEWKYYNTTYHRRSYTCSYGDSGIYYENEKHSTSTTHSQHNTSQHKVNAYCSACSTTITSSYADHSFRYGSWTNYNNEQHRRTKTCTDCGFSTFAYESHSFSYDSWASSSNDEHSRSVTCSCGYSATESEAHNWVYGKWTALDEKQHQRDKGCSCGTLAIEYGDHADTDSNGICDDCGYLMTCFSVTVPASMALAMAEDGEIFTSSIVKIVNNSTGAVKVTGVTVTANGNWSIVPYDFNIAAAKVDSKQIGFAVNGACTTVTGNTEALNLGGGWVIARGTSLPLAYDAIVSATSQVIQAEQVLTLVFVIDWAA